MARLLESFDDLYADELQDLFDAEQQLAKALPEMADATSSAVLKKQFADSGQRTKERAERVKSVLQALNRDPSGHRCKGMEGLLAEGRDRMNNEGEPHVIDAGLIVLAQKAEHYGMAGYGSVCTFANMFQRLDDARILHQALEEKRDADETLTQLAKESVNIVAHAQ